MNTDKAYLLGLVIGGGVFGNAEEVFKIKLPYKKWGSYLDNPERAGKIAGDILNKVGQMFRAIYGISVQYETTEGGTWSILCEGDTSSLRSDLNKYGIECNGEIRGTANINKLVVDLVDDNLKRRFIAGLADTIGSMAKSHRRFSDEHQILSFEIKGYNFQFVCDLCRLLYSINCIPDQVNWNHPNIHCTRDSYYNQWNKGFKLRILLDQYAKFGAFAFKTKAESSIENRKLQQETHSAEKCEDRDFHITPSTVHPAEHDPRLPEIIRDGHYLHFRHFCAVLGCEHAPFDAIYPYLKDAGQFINPFPILCKDNESEIKSIISKEPIMSNRTYTALSIPVLHLIDLYNENKNALLFESGNEAGYPINEVLQAVAYIIADNSELSGKRPKGYMDILERHCKDDKDLCIDIQKPDLLTPLILIGNGRGALVGPVNPTVYKKLIIPDESNKYKFSVRKITEDDLKNE